VFSRKRLGSNDSSSQLLTLADAATFRLFVPEAEEKPVRLL